jgi:hypothetical protein
MRRAHPCKSRFRRDPERGASFILTILVMFILTILGLALLFSTTTEFQIAGAEATVNKTFYAADSGIQYAYLQGKHATYEGTGTLNSCGGAKAAFWCFDLPDLMPGSTTHTLSVEVSPFRLNDFKLDPGSEINVDSTPLYDKGYSLSSVATDAFLNSQKQITVDFVIGPVPLSVEDVGH